MYISKTVLWVVLAIVVVALGAGAWFMWGGNSVQVSKTTLNQQLQASDFNWNYSDAGSNPTNSAPKTKVTLSVRGGTPKEVGTFDGSCFKLQPEVLQDGEVSGVLCWFAGYGDEIGVFKEGDKFVVKQGEQSEGSPEEVGFRGNFKTLFEVK